MKDIIKACLALILVAFLAICVFYKDNSDNKGQEKNFFMPKGRIDVYIPQGKTDNLEVLFNNKNIQKEAWSKDNEFYTIQTSDLTISFSVKANKNETITLKLRGPWDKKTDGSLAEHWVKFTSLVINDKKALTIPQEVWHNKSYYYTFTAKKGKTYTIEGIWEPKK